MSRIACTLEVKKHNAPTSSNNNVSIPNKIYATINSECIVRHMLQYIEFYTMNHTDA